MTVDLCGISLAHPIINASGTFDAIAAQRVFGDSLHKEFPFAAYVSKTVTVKARQGNPPPRLWEVSDGLVNSIGLPNRGLTGFLEHDLPQLAQLPVPLIINVMGFSPEEFSLLITEFSACESVAALELNVSCPNVKTGLSFGTDATELTRLLNIVRPLTDKPLIVKLTPNCESPEEIAHAAQTNGADAVSAINTVTAFARHPKNPAHAWLGGVTGGLSGPAIRTRALAHVRAVRLRTSLPIIAMGGVQNGQHAYDLMQAGASAVAVGTESFREPLAARRIKRELVTLMA